MKFLFVLCAVLAGVAVVICAAIMMFEYLENGN